ncbi:XTP/dITP diphosphatase [Bacillus alveayuensis]|jgi:XTP/dITP diphosphohydrolase|uniref:dITP/XTP pyrophosphatase n=1 Tax=Aeribacillus alveayuensis TaxID=279215 RepID=A0ABT9VJK1_9BACI|nr:XTP/dITP diphosphatase [Bacillus alveayuensis]MDQ0161152.1 XTP/dITP diphosphohydrolase [Bacillus alveayuensis]
MKELIIASKNEGKVREFKEMLEPKGFKVLSLLDLNEAPDVEETGKTFEENAILKAETISNMLKKPVIADDSGLSIDALNGEPGVYSARYAGNEKNDEKNIEKVLEKLKGVPHEQRTARFQCVLALAIPGQKTITVEGVCEGIITKQPIGQNGFGYDPIFYVQEKGKTMAQLEKKEKNQISHRANALKKLEKIINHWGEFNHESADH